jgi:hypothetical protein
MVQPTTEFHTHRRQRHRQRAAEAGDPYHDRRGWDLKPLFYRFIRRLIHIIEKCLDNHPVIMLVGDARQEVNRWNHADARFATMSDRLGYN